MTDDEMNLRLCELCEEEGCQRMTFSQSVAAIRLAREATALPRGPMTEEWADEIASSHGLFGSGDEKYVSLPSAIDAILEACAEVRLEEAKRWAKVFNGAFGMLQPAIKDAERLLSEATTGFPGKAGA